MKPRSSIVSFFLLAVLLSACTTDPSLESVVRKLNREAEQAGDSHRYRTAPSGGIEKYAVGPQTQVPERWNFSFDSRSWQLGYQRANPSQAVREYVLSDQSVENWSEKVTSFYAITDISPKIWFERFREDFLRRCPTTRFSFIDESADGVIFEWQHDGCEDQPPQHEIRRHSRGRMGLLSLSYVEKTNQLAREKRNAWILILRSATVRLDV
jgi:hypothetical protein